MALDAERVLDAVRPHVDGGAVPGAIIGVSSGGVVSLTAAGTTEPGGSRPLDPGVPVRISSNTKPIIAALALTLVQDGRLALDAPVEEHVPELADRRVLRRPDADLHDTVPAVRPINLRDLLTMRMGFGHVLDGPCPAAQEAARAGLGFGPPDPANPLSPDEWIARFAALPLLDQPGTAWRYEISFAVLGVLLARATRTPLDVLLRERLLDPLGMTDTAFCSDTLPPAYRQDDGGLVLFDDAGPDSRWTMTPAFRDGCGRLVSTARDLLRFAGLLLAGEACLLSDASVPAMTVVADPPGLLGARYGWAGGLGTLWWSWRHTTRPSSCCPRCPRCSTRSPPPWSPASPKTPRPEPHDGKP